MSYFTKQRIVRAKTLGDKLQEARLEQNISLERAARDLNIAFKYLEALETNNLGALPGRPYLKNFLKLYCQYLHINFNDCWAAVEEMAERETSKFFGVKKRYFFTWPKFIKRFLMVAAVLAVLIFLGLKVQSIFAPPPLVIYNPQDGLITSERELAISGHSQKEATIFINNLAVYVDGQGDFKAAIDLQKGLNLIKITASKRYSRTRDIELRVLLKE